MSTRCSRKWAEELSAPAVGEDESPQGLTVGDLMDPHQLSVDPQQRTEVFTPEHSGDQNVRAHGPQTVPVQVQSPIGMAVEAMEATEWLNTVFNQIRTSMNRMSPKMKELLIVPKPKSSGKTIEPRNNWAHDKAAAKAATE
ncbi:hypothetical protein M422DRAFT_257074 [Sphaerobolus stellatus SS14]|uniref:Uncharacterized protein n=1 Tax=Sphaerobolus stellatus (strain SS14) TaxID=990650 RepID=A0A0C9VF47_SPHS4|nr:hypothetical protein M422DRAFT_257074 [Sphaerobolus stellatus SS14]